MACHSGARTVEYAQRLAELSNLLQRPTSVESIHTIVDELLTETLKMCSVNLELARNLDLYSERALSMMC